MPPNLGEVDIRSVGINWDICQLHQWVGERAPPPEGWRSSSRNAMQTPNSDQNSNSYQILTPDPIYLLGAYRVRNHRNCDAHIGQMEIMPCYQWGLSFLNPWTGLYGIDSFIQIFALYFILIPQIRQMFIPYGHQGGAAGPVSTTFPPFTSHCPLPPLI